MKNFTHTFLLLTLISLFSCGKNDSDLVSQPIDYASLTGAEYLAAYTTPAILFNYAVVNEEEETLSGWFIDDTGKVYDYNISSSTYTVDAPVVSINKLQSLKNKGVLSEKIVDLVEVVDHYKKTRATRDGDFSIGMNDPSATNTVYVIAYDLQIGEADCTSCPVSTVSANDRAQRVLKMSGRTAGHNVHKSAEEIVDWIETLAKDF